MMSECQSSQRVIMDSIAAMKTLRQKPDMQLRQLVVVKRSTIFSSQQTAALPFLTSRYMTIEERLSGSSSGGSFDRAQQQRLISFVISLEILTIVFSLVMGVPLLQSQLTNFKLSPQGWTQPFSSILLLISDSVRLVSVRVNLLLIPKKQVGLLLNLANCVQNKLILFQSLVRMHLRRKRLILVRLKMMPMMRLYTFSFFINFPHQQVASCFRPYISVTMPTISWTKTAVSSTTVQYSPTGNWQRYVQKAEQSGLRKPPYECSWKICAHLRKSLRDWEYSSRLISGRYIMLICTTSDLFCFMLCWKESAGFASYGISYYSPVSLPQFQRMRQELRIYSYKFSEPPLMLCEEPLRIDDLRQVSVFMRSSRMPELQRYRVCMLSTSLRRGYAKPQVLSSLRCCLIESSNSFCMWQMVRCDR